MVRLSTDETRCVAENLRVHGTDSLWMISDAVFPDLGAVKPMLTLASTTESVPAPASS